MNFIANLSNSVCTLHLHSGTNNFSCSFIESDAQGLFILSAENIFLFFAEFFSPCENLVGMALIPAVWIYGIFEMVSNLSTQLEM